MHRVLNTILKRTFVNNITDIISSLSIRYGSKADILVHFHVDLRLIDRAIVNVIYINLGNCKAFMPMSKCNVYIRTCVRSRSHESIRALLSGCLELFDKYVDEKNLLLLYPGTPLLLVFILLLQHLL